MTTGIFISICIPAYKRTVPLKRLLDSIIVQQYRDFEVIITDDSPDRGIEDLCAEYSNLFNIRYFHNALPLGTPENWNEAVRRAGGEWIKLMHDDDWFADQNSLETFASAVAANIGCPFIFSAYRNIYPSGETRDIFPDPFVKRKLRSEPAVLFTGNCIGPPSCILYKRREDLIFDVGFKWLVDIDFYIRYLNAAKPVYIPVALVNIGISNTQVTTGSFGVRQVEIPEYLGLLSKTGASKLRNMLVYDAFWRLIRNLDIASITQIREAGYKGLIPGKIASIIAFQRRIPDIILKTGLFSKFLMMLSFCISYYNNDAARP